MKKILAVMMILALAAAALALCGCAKHTHIVVESRRVEDYFCSFYEDGTVDITGYYGSAEELKLPNAINGSKVIGFGIKAFDGCGTIKAVYIPTTVESLPAKLFNSCPNLEKIYIPQTVVSIGKNAVFNCPAFTTVLFEGTSEQWDAIDVGSVPWTDNYVLINSEIVFGYSLGK